MNTRIALLPTLRAETTSSRLFNNAIGSGSLGQIFESDGFEPRTGGRQQRFALFWLAVEPGVSPHGWINRLRSLNEQTAAVRGGASKQTNLLLFRLLTFHFCHTWVVIVMLGVFGVGSTTTGFNILFPGTKRRCCFCIGITAFSELRVPVSVLAAMSTLWNPRARLLSVL